MGVKQIFDNVVKDIRKDLGSYRGKLGNIEGDQEQFLHGVSDIFTLIINLVNIVINMLEALVDSADIVVLLVPAGLILFVVSKLTQIL